MVATRRAKAEATARAFTTLDVEMLSGIASFGGRRELWGLAAILKSPTGRELMPKDATFLASRDRVVLRKCVPSSAWRATATTQISTLASTTTSEPPLRRSRT